MVALAVFDSAVEAEVVFDDVVRGTVVEVDVPSVVAAPAGVTQGVGHDHVEQRQLRGGLHPGVDFGCLWHPEAVAAPGVKTAVVAGFLDGVEHVAELDEVAAKGAVADVDAGARHVVDRAVAHGDRLGDVDLHAGGLLFHPTGQVDQAVLDQRIGGVVGGQRSGRAVECFELQGLVVVKKRISHRLLVADEADAAGAGLANFAAANGDAAVVIINKHRVAADLVDECVGERAVLGAVDKNRAAAVDRPVGAQQRFLGVHHGAGGLAEGETAQGDETHRGLFVAGEFDEGAQAGGFDRGGGEVEPGGRIIIKRVGGAVEEPFAGGVELFEQVFDEAD